MSKSNNHIGPYLRELSELPARRGRLPKLMMDRITLLRSTPDAGPAVVYVFHVFDPRKPAVLLGNTRSYDRAEQMALGEIPVAVELAA